MGQKSPHFMLLFIFITIFPNLYENANGATYTDLTIADFVTGRLYVPNAYPNNNDYDNKNLPLVIYYHGGGFAVGSYSDISYDNFVGAIVDRSNIVTLSVDYRLLDVSSAYNDSWSALHYVASHHNRTGPNPTLNNLVDFQRIFLSGDSAGGNIAHNMAMKIATNKIRGLKVKGIALLCPYFWGLVPLLGEPIDPLGRLVENSLWITYAKTLNVDDIRINPLVDPNLKNIGTSNILVITGYSDPLYFRGKLYAKTLQTNGYRGKVTHTSYNGMHDFFLAGVLDVEYYGVLDQVASFFNRA